MQELLRAKQTFQLDQAIKKLDRFEVLVIDDLSYTSCNPNETDVLFALLAARYEQRSVVITSNLTFPCYPKHIGTMLQNIGINCTRAL